MRCAVRAFNPERIAKLIYDKSREAGLDVVAVPVWETPSSFAEYTT